MNNKGYR